MHLLWNLSVLSDVQVPLLPRETEGQTKGQVRHAIQAGCQIQDNLEVISLPDDARRKARAGRPDGVGSACDVGAETQGKDTSGPIYMIHEHHARKMHWDLRLEFDGALKSWALPKQPPSKIGERRLAVQVPDHPIGYAEFEGEIPEGSYGAGSVRIWDSGTFVMLERKEDKMIVSIRGKKLSGKYCLLHFRPAEKSWLFFKISDAWRPKNTASGSADSDTQ